MRQTGNDGSPGSLRTRNDPADEAASAIEEATGLQTGYVLDLDRFGQDLGRFVELLKRDPQLRYHRADRDLLLDSLEQLLEQNARTDEEAVFDTADLARDTLPLVVTDTFRRETRELLEDCLKFRVWPAEDRQALVTALMLSGLEDRARESECNPLWIALLGQSIEDLISLENSLLPLMETTDTAGISLERPEDPMILNQLLEGTDCPKHYLFQPLFQGAHRAAQLITEDRVATVIPLYEILPIFLAVFQVWAEASDYGKRETEQMPGLHENVLMAFQTAAERTLDDQVVTSISEALSDAAQDAAASGETPLGELLCCASRFSETVPWQSNPLTSQFLLKLCSSPETCCVGPGAAEALRLAGDPTVYEHYHNYGTALLKSGELRGAGRVFAAGLEHLGDSWRGLLDLALVYRALGEGATAAKVFQEALKAPDLTEDATAQIETERAGVSRGLDLSPPFDCRE